MASAVCFVIAVGLQRTPLLEVGSLKILSYPV